MPGIKAVDKEGWEAARRESAARSPEVWDMSTLVHPSSSSKTGVKSASSCELREREFRCDFVKRLGVCLELELEK